MSSLRAQLKKFRFQGKLTTEEYEALIKKLDGHDEKIKADAFNEFVESYREFINAPCDEACFKKEIDVCDGICIDCFEKWFKEKK